MGDWGVASCVRKVVCEVLGYEFESRATRLVTLIIAYISAPLVRTDGLYLRWGKGNSASVHLFRFFDEGDTRVPLTLLPSTIANASVLHRPTGVVMEMELRTLLLSKRHNPSSYIRLHHSMAKLPKVTIGECQLRCVKRCWQRLAPPEPNTNQEHGNLAGYCPIPAPAKIYDAADVKDDRDIKGDRARKGARPWPGLCVRLNFQCGVDDVIETNVEFRFAVAPDASQLILFHWLQVDGQMRMRPRAVYRFVPLDARHLPPHSLPLPELDPLDTLATFQY
jgi:hypothetical protein